MMRCLKVTSSSIKLGQMLNHLDLFYQNVPERQRKLRNLRRRPHQQPLRVDRRPLRLHRQPVFKRLLREGEDDVRPSGVQFENISIGAALGIRKLLQTQIPKEK
jgi:hypothetical protein